MRAQRPFLAAVVARWAIGMVRFACIVEKVGLRKRSTTATKNYIVETRQGPAPTNVPSEVQCKDRWYVGSLLDQARHQSGMYRVANWRPGRSACTLLAPP